jgi:hypothetical protein
LFWLLALVAFYLGCGLTMAAAFLKWNHEHNVEAGDGSYGLVILFWPVVFIGIVLSTMLHLITGHVD